MGLLTKQLNTMKQILPILMLLLFTSCYTYRIKKAADREFNLAYNLWEESFNYIGNPAKYYPIYIKQLYHQKRCDSLFFILCTVKRKDGLKISTYHNIYDTCK